MKQVIVIRKDLNMRKGKMCAQAAHASIGSLFQRSITPTTRLVSVTFSENDPRLEWLATGQKKIVVGTENEDSLLTLVNLAMRVPIPVNMVIDAGLTEFHEPTLTCAAFGPAPDEDLDKITGHLKLL